MGSARGALAAVLLGGLVATPAAAQISPGPLSTAHAGLEGIGRCLECHGVRGEDVDPDCRKCHLEIDRLITEGRGFHALEGKEACAKCHPEHGGRDFALIEWPGGKPEAFDHRKAGWALAGKHRDVECRRCHKAEHRREEVAALRPGGSSDESWLALATDCGVCHRDPHEDRFGRDCERCHTEESWKRIREESFDHGRTRYPLEGAHRDVECAKCHDPERGGSPRPAFARCVDCHADAHAGTATLAGRPVDCNECHSLRWFRPTTFTSARHAEAVYPLEGRHARVKCESCHPKAEGKQAVAAYGTARIVLRPASRRCTDCHDDTHGGQLAAWSGGGECTACHDLNGFKPSTFTTARHDSLSFPLDGKHAAAECRACHAATRNLLPPLPAEPSLGRAAFGFRPPAATCTECHRDPHAGRFADGGTRATERGCRACHGMDTFRLSTFDVASHAQSRFPLEGAHRAIPCLDCHRELARETSGSSLRLATAASNLEFVTEDRSCAGCHGDPHRGQFAARPDGGDCAACHGLESFRPALGLEHDRDSAFPLKGAHAAVACARCHVPGVPDGAPAGADPVTIWRPLSHRCEDCHAIPPAPLEGRDS